MKFRKAANIVLVLLLTANVAFGQAVRNDVDQLKKIDVVEHLGDTIPLDLDFYDEAGNPVTLRDYFHQDKPVVLALAYYSCPMLCTLVLNGMSDAVQRLPWKIGEKFEMIVVSIEPSETPELARAKKENYLKPIDQPDAAEGWHFLTGAADQSKALADAVGFKYYWDESQKQWAHPAVLMLISPSGKITRYLYGIEYPERDLRLGLIESSEGKVGSTVDRIILYCYHYDPDAGGYVLFAQNVMMIGGIATVVLLGLLILFLWIRERRRHSIPTPHSLTGSL